MEICLVGFITQTPPLKHVLHKFPVFTFLIHNCQKKMEDSFEARFGCDRADEEFRGDLQVS